MRRFFFTPSNRDGNRVQLDAEESHHIAKVLRLKEGHEVELLDGEGKIYSAVICSLQKQTELILKGVREEPEENPELLLLQSILKKEKMDLVVQKATELGVSQLFPVHTSRCQGKPDIAAKKNNRWRRISLAACKQSLRSRTMQIMQPAALKTILQDVPEDFLKLIFWEQEKSANLHAVAKQATAAPGLALFLGPEGGLTKEEVALAVNYGWKTIGLGERILRAETATITAVSVVQFLAGRL